MAISRFSTPAQLLAVALALAPVLGCHAQTPQASSTSQAQLDRKIELAVRAQLNVPPNWDIQPGERTSSDIPGYDKLQVVFYPSAEPGHRQPIEFLIAKDNSELARLSKFSLTKIPGMDIDTTGRPMRGTEGAKVTIVNFDDLECPFCAKMHAELFPETLDHYKGLVKIVYKDDPLVQIHPWAMHASVDANCIAQQSPAAYWSYVDYLHTHGEDVTGPDRDAKKSFETLDRLAREEGTRSKLKAPELDACIAKQDETKIHNSMQEAEALQVDGTPALFINGERVSGAQPIPYLWAVIDRALKAEGVTPPPNPNAQPAQPGAAGATASR